MYSSGLVPRRMPWLGLIGGPLLLIGSVGVLFDVWDATGAVGILVIPEFLWELFLGIYAASGDSGAAPILRPHIAPHRAWRGDAAPDTLPTSWQRLLALSGVAFAVLFVSAGSQRWQHAGLHGCGSGVDDLGG